MVAEVNMTEKMIAKCGLICSDCEAFLATQANDVGALTRMADEANQQYGMSMTWEDGRCFGCQSDLKKIGYCDSCTIRICAVERGLENCAHCKEYGCETLTNFLEKSPQAKATLTDIRGLLS
jgi:hypothetical protein